MKFVFLFCFVILVACSNKKDNGTVNFGSNYIEYNLLDKVYGDYSFIKVLERDETTGKIDSGVGYIVTKMEEAGYFQFTKLIFYKKENGENAIITTYARYYSHRVDEDTLEANFIESMCVDKKSGELKENFDLLALNKTKYKMVVDSESEVKFEFNGFNLKYTRFASDTVINQFVNDGYVLEFGFCNEENINEI